METIKRTDIYPKITRRDDLEVGKNYCGTTGDGKNVPCMARVALINNFNRILGSSFAHPEAVLVGSDEPLEGLCGTRPDGECNDCEFNQVVETEVELNVGRGAVEALRGLQVYEGVANPLDAID